MVFKRRSLDAGPVPALGGPPIQGPLSRVSQRIQEGGQRGDLTLGWHSLLEVRGAGGLAGAPLTGLTVSGGLEDAQGVASGSQSWSLQARGRAFPGAGSPAIAAAWVQRDRGRMRGGDQWVLCQSAWEFCSELDNSEARSEVFKKRSGTT